MEVSQYRGQDLGRGNDMQRHATSQKWFEIKHIQGYIEALSLCVGYRHHEREGTTVDASAPASRRHRPDTPTTALGGRRTGREGRCDRLPRVFQPTCPVCSRHCVVKVRQRSAGVLQGVASDPRNFKFGDYGRMGGAFSSVLHAQTHDRIIVRI
jgi:hypothetical protein